MSVDDNSPESGRGSSKLKEKFPVLQQLGHTLPVWFRDIIPILICRKLFTLYHILNVVAQTISEKLTKNAKSVTTTMIDSAGLIDKTIFCCCLMASPALSLDSPNLYLVYNQCV